MMKRITTIVNNLNTRIAPLSRSITATQQPNQPYSTKTGVKFSKKYSNDNMNKTHVHVCKEKCVLQDCETKECPTLCDTRTETEILGHNTHKPPIGRMARRIFETDAKGDNKSQWFVKSNRPNKISEQERQQSTKDIKPDAKQNDFIQTHTDKYED